MIKNPSEYSSLYLESLMHSSVVAKAMETPMLVSIPYPLLRPMRLATQGTIPAAHTVVEG